MKYKFIKIKRHDFDFEPYWVVCVDNTERLMAYLDILAKRNVENYSLAKQTIIKQAGNPHFGSLGGNGRLQHIIVMELSKHTGRNTVADDLMIVGDIFSKPYIKVFMKSGELHCNPAGGFCPAAAYEFDVIDTIESNDFKFPADSVENVKNAEYGLRPRILQWPNGTHYYAKVGIEDVQDEQGNVKWDTYADAEKALDWYIKTKVHA